MVRKKPIVIIIMILFCVQLFPFSSTVLMAQKERQALILLDNMEENWYDGWFNGTWTRTDLSASGIFQGKMNILRNEKSAVLTGILRDETQEPIGFLKGYYKHPFLFGQIRFDSTEGIMSIFFGKLSVDTNQIQGDLMILGYGSVTFSGMADYSFLPRPTGPYSIGVIDRHLIDTDRLEEFTEDPTDVREFMIRIWYPIETPLTLSPVEYMDFETFQWLKNRSPIPLITISDTAYLSVNPHGYLSDLSTSPIKRCPVLIFSPGYDGNYEIYTSFIEEMVSHGYIVISMNHPYVSGLTVFPDGRMIKATSVKPWSFPSIVNDALFVLDYIEQLNQSDPLFSGKMKIDHIGMYGHSFGGASTLYCMQQDSRITAGLTLDGAFSSDIIPDSFDSAFCMLLAEESFARNNSELILDAMDDDGYILRIKGSTHYAFTDVGLLMHHLLPLIPAHLLQFGTIEAKRMVNITRIVIKDFFDVYLKNAPLDQFFDSVSLFDEVILSQAE